MTSSIKPEVHNISQRRRMRIEPRPYVIKRHKIYACIALFFVLLPAAEWLACWTQAQKGMDSNPSRDAVG